MFNGFNLSTITGIYIGSTAYSEIYLGSVKIWPAGLPIGTTYDFDYTGTVQSQELPAGTYKLQVWGAQGGSSTGTYAATGSKGGYSEGILTLASTTTLYVFVGGAGETINSSSTSTTVVNGGWNGGGGAKPYNNSSSRYSYPRPGGGATDIALVTSTMDYSSNRTNRSSDSLLSRIIVAGGGGGSSYYRYSTSTRYTSSGVSVGGGTSGGGGYPGTQSSAGTGGGLGYGANQSATSRVLSGAGGGGWYGGGAGGGTGTVYVDYGGGGSGFVNTTENAQYRPTGYTGLELVMGATYAGNTSFPSISDGDETGHSGDGYARITCVDPAITTPLTFIILGNGTIGWKKESTSSSINNLTIQYRKNGGEWTSITSTADGATISVSTGDTLEFKGSNTRYYGIIFTSTCDFNARGNIMSLMDYANSFSSGSAFELLFHNNTHLLNAGSLVLPVMTLTEQCYKEMFAGCTNLAVAPKLPATTLDTYCYGYMFNGCAITIAPELPATTLAPRCYEGMFTACTGLTKAPDLIAPAPSGSGQQEYNYMFWQCSNLNYIKCLTVRSSGTLSFAGFTDGVAATGTFVKPSEATWSTGINGIPSGWTVENMTHGFTFSSQSVAIDNDGGSIQITVESWYPWTATTANDWITISPSSSSSFETTVTITIASSTALSRSGSITFSDGTTTSSVIVSQAAPEVSEYFTFEILGDGNITWIKSSNTADRTIQYSKNNGTWISITSSTSGVSIAVTTGDVIRFKGDNSAYGNQTYRGSYFDSTCDFNVRGNIMSLINSTNFTNASFGSSAVCIFRMFFKLNTYLKDASHLVLPADVIHTQAYDNMFYGCTNLTGAPMMGASVVNGKGCFQMFYGCTSLITAPELPTTRLDEYCYKEMFYGCTSLTTAPELPVTNLYQSCYYGMFQRCTSLTTAPELPATTLADDCYGYMFYGCTSLNYVKCLATDRSATLCTSNWLNGVASTGTFVKAASTTWSTGTSGIPSGWTVEDA